MRFVIILGVLASGYLLLMWTLLRISAIADAHSERLYIDSIIHAMEKEFDQ